MLVQAVLCCAVLCCLVYEQTFKAAAGVIDVQNAVVLLRCCNIVLAMAPATTHARNLKQLLYVIH